ncbi:MAG: hypothetical protein V9G18_02525 [Albidovulum sp.]
MVKSVGALSEEATILPGSAARSSTTPVIGERISVLSRSERTEEAAASASVTSARAISSAAFAPLYVAS